MSVLVCICGRSSCSDTALDFQCLLLVERDSLAQIFHAFVFCQYFDVHFTDFNISFCVRIHGALVAKNLRLVWVYLESHFLGCFLEFVQHISQLFFGGCEQHHVVGKSQVREAVSVMVAQAMFGAEWFARVNRPMSSLKHVDVWARAAPVVDTAPHLERAVTPPNVSVVTTFICHFICVARSLAACDMVVPPCTHHGFSSTLSVTTHSPWISLSLLLFSIHKRFFCKCADVNSLVVLYCGLIHDGQLSPKWRDRSKLRRLWR